MQSNGTEDLQGSPIRKKQGKMIDLLATVIHEPRHSASIHCCGRDSTDLPRNYLADQSQYSRMRASTAISEGIFVLTQIT